MLLIGAHIHQEFSITAKQRSVKDIGKSKTHGAHNGERTDTSDLPQETLVEFASNQAPGSIDQGHIRI
jgi:hypothetical protein